MSIYLLWTRSLLVYPTSPMSSMRCFLHAAGIGLIGLLRMAYNLVPTQKLRVTGWTGSGDFQYLRVIGYQIRTGLGVGLYVDMCDTANANVSLQFNSLGDSIHNGVYSTKNKLG